VGLHQSVPGEIKSNSPIVTSIALQTIPAMLVDHFQILKPDLKTKADRDPRATLAVDVGTLLEAPALQEEELSSGLVSGSSLR
jgi:hypothetical protein